MERPTARWARLAAEQTEAVAAGTLPHDDAFAPRLWPAAFTAAADAALADYEAAVARTGPDAPDEELWALVEGVVTALNAVDEEHQAIETGEREELAEYVDDVLTAAGVDVGALTARRGTGREELTDRWRDW